MQELAAVWLLCVLAGTSCAIFYTNSKENDYPRIGKRAFFTMGEKGSSYPRIGRSSDAAVSGTSSDAFSPFRANFGEQDTDNSGFMSRFHHHHRILPAVLKRGIFTGGSSGYPRIGRRSGPLGIAGQGGDVDGGDVEQEEEGQTGLSAAAAALTSSLERSADADNDDDVVGESGLPRYEVPLGLLFFSFDKNGDKTLSRDEFVQGMARARQDGSACR